MTCGETADDLVMTDCSESHGGHATALRAVRLAAELAGGDDGLEIGGDGVSGAGEDAVLWGSGRVEELADGGLVHVEDGIEGPQAEEFGDDLGTDGGREDLRAGGALLGSEDAHPDLAGFRAVAPEAEELFEVAGPAGDLSGDGAVDGDFGLSEVFEDALVGCGGAAEVVFGLEAVDRDDDIQAFEAGPVSGNGTEGAGDDLEMDAAAVDLGEQSFEFAEAHEGIAADERDVEGAMFVDEFKDVAD
jgi:hypothetical protein